MAVYQQQQIKQSSTVMSDAFSSITTTGFRSIVPPSSDASIKSRIFKNLTLEAFQF